MSSLSFNVFQEGTNGAPIASITEISEIKQTVVKEGATEVDLSERRVFLLGENRWEEPSRLAGRGNQDAGSKAKKATTQCLTCRGEGHLMCLGTFVTAQIESPF